MSIRDRQCTSIIDTQYAGPMRK